MIDDVVDIGNYVVQNKFLADIYVEHEVDENSGLVDVPKYVMLLVWVMSHKMLLGKRVKVF